MISLERKKGSIKQKFYFLFWAVLIVFFGVGLSLQFGQYKVFSAEKNELAIKIETQTSVNENLKKELDYYGSDSYVERVASEKLGLVKPDEIVFVNSNK